MYNMQQPFLKLLLLMNLDIESIFLSYPFVMSEALLFTESRVF